MKKCRVMAVAFGLVVLSAACGPRPAAVQQDLIETRVAATFTAIQAAEPDPTAQPSPATQAVTPNPTRTAGPPSATAAASPTPSPAGLKPADSDAPAAGICAGDPGRVVSITIVPGAMPDVRCMQVTTDQRLEFRNATGAAVRVRLGRYDLTLPAGETALLDAPCGDYLEPGAHIVTVSEGAVPEIWLIATAGD